MSTQRKVVNFWGGVFLLSLLCLLLAPGQGQAATFTVNSTADVAGLAANCVAGGAAQCTLRSAIQAANASAAADTIVLPAGTYTLAIPGRNENLAATGDLDIVVAGGALTITGAGAATTIIDGGGIDRVFDVIAQSAVVISGVTIRNGNSGGITGGGILTGGAGISLTLNNVVISGNTTGVANIEGDAVDIGAGGATVTMDNVAIVNNNSLGGGNIIAVGAGGTSLTMTNSAISGNNDSAINNGGTLNLTNVTISGNTAVNGTGIDNKAASTVNLVNVTITDNIATPPANIGGVRNAAGGVVNAKNTIIANNTPINCSVALTSQGNNLSNTAGCFAAVADIVAAAPLLSPLASNGGLVQTVALLPGSPAIDAGAAAGCPATDARGVTRPFAGLPPAAAVCDIGAFEFRPQQITVTLPPPFDFGNVLVNSTAASHIITLGNAGDGPLNIGTTAPPAAPFSFTADGCSGQRLTQIPLPPTTCAMTIGFTPTVAVTSSGTFTIPSNDPVTPAFAFALSGTGSPTTVPGISITDSIPPVNDLTIPFGGVTVGNSADATVTITNTGTANLVLGTIANADPLAAPFSITSNTCSGATIAPSATCTFSLRFAPTSDGPVTDTFDVPTNVTGQTSVTITVNGSGGTATGTTGNNPPSNPVLVSPANGATGIPTTMTFVWKKSFDPQGDAITYHFENCTDTNFTTGCTNSDVQAAAPFGLLYAGLGSFSAGIVLIGFVTGGGLKRSRKTMIVVTLLLLAGGLFMSCTRTKTNEIVTTIPGTNPGEAGHIATGLAAGTTYYWKVVADDGKGGLSSSEVWSYTTAP
jgi:CSLREA domain-containing protein